MSAALPILNFLLLSDRIATAGQPTAAQFADLRTMGYRTVINLALPTSTNALLDEQAIVEAQGMQYIHIPVEWESPTLENLEQFFAVMRSAKSPVLVHCAMNMRVSVFMYLYRRICEQISEEVAQQDLERIWTPNATWQQFIKQAIAHYQPNS